MECTPNSITQFVNFNENLIIPFFQRSYVWDVDQWDRLLEDLKFASSTRRPHFLGSVILKEQKNDFGQRTGMLVIDGQQRLTTLAIFFKVFYLLTNQTLFFDRTFMRLDGTPVIKQSYSCKDDFNKIMKLTQLEDLSDYPSQSNIIQAYTHFRKELREILLIQDNKDENGKTILDMSLDMLMTFVVMKVGDQEDEQQIFDTINSLGVKLSTGELLKNHLFSNSDVEVYNSIWKDAFEANDECLDFWDKTITTGRLGKKNIEIFLYYYIQIKSQERDLIVDKKQCRRWENLFATYKSLIKDNNFDKIQIAKEICEYAKLYKATFDPELANDDIPSEFGLERLNFIVQNLDSTTIIPYVLYVIKNAESDEQRLNIYKFLEKYLLRRIVANSKSSNYSDLFTENLIGQGINSYEKLVEYFKVKESTAALAIPSDDKVAFGFKDTEFKNNKRALSVLYLMESMMRSGYHATRLHKFDGYSLEHLMPKKWKKNWSEMPEDVTPEIREKAINTLGNMAMITSGLNSSISNESWQNKKNGKNKHSGLVAFAADIETMHDVLSKDVWDETTISERADWLAQKAIDMWSI